MRCEFTPATFHDVDHFSAWEQGLGWDIESTQLTAGANEIGFDHILFPGVLAGHFGARQSMHYEFRIPTGMALLIVSRAPLALTWDGLEIPPTRMAIVQADRPHWAVLPAGWDSYEFMISESMLRANGLRPADLVAGSSGADLPVLPLARVETTRFLQGMDRMFEALRDGPQPAIAADRAAACYEFILSGLQCLTDASLGIPEGERPRTTRRADLVERARRHMVEHVAETLTVAQIARALDVSARVLRYAFQDAMGMSPYRYFLTVKLHATRRALKAGNATVTQAAIAHGFSTPSRFARQYRRLFGELPSQTAAAPRA